MRPWLARDLLDFGRTAFIASVCAVSAAVAPHWLLRALVIVPCAAAVALSVPGLVHSLRELARIRRLERDAEGLAAARAVHDS